MTSPFEALYIVYEDILCHLNSAENIKYLTYKKTDEPIRYSTVKIVWCIHLKLYKQFDKKMTRSYAKVIYQILVKRSPKNNETASKTINKNKEWEEK